jgi:hypothetical protein
MKIILRLFCAMCVLAFYVNPVRAAPAATNESLQLTIELRDGSRIVGKSLKDTVSFRSAALGDMKLLWSSIRAIKYIAGADTARLMATNGDVFTIQLVADTLRLETSFGKIDLPVKLIRSIRVSTMTKLGQLTSDLIAWWKGENNALDSAGTNNGTLTGAATFGTGEVGQGFVFDGNNGSGVALGNPAGLQLQDFTIEGWIKRGSATAVSQDPSGPGVIFGCGFGGYIFYMGSDGGLLFNKLGDPTPLRGPFITDTNFHHVALTKVGSVVTFYLDGAASSVSSDPTTFTFTTSIGIGCRPDNLGNSFLGTIDELSFYGRAISAAEIQAIYTKQQ